MSLAGANASIGEVEARVEPRQRPITEPDMLCNCADGNVIS